MSRLASRDAILRQHRSSPARCVLPDVPDVPDVPDGTSAAYDQNRCWAQALGTPDLVALCHQAAHDMAHRMMRSPSGDKKKT
jgi:hypothetical protein